MVEYSKNSKLKISQNKDKLYDGEEYANIEIKRTKEKKDTQALNISVNKHSLYDEEEIKVLETKKQKELDKIEKIICKVCNILVEKDYYTKHIVGIAHNLKMESIKAPKNLFIRANNIGYKLLKKNGWKYDKGLGANEQGIREPIKPKIKKDRLGIGAGKSKNEVLKPKINRLTQREVVKAEEMERMKRIRILNYLNN
ncbi:G-patch-domain-containing protein [Neoconidiobolus thromboides FSU 785]|nr:G-patch-domain-containing protein [Neoconidiobolus thromboides FSU 785]